MRFRSYLLTALAVAALVTTVAAARGGAAAQPAVPTVVATGLNNPRGLAFDASGSLYVAEGGTGGSLMTSMHDCQQVPPIIGPYSGGFTARISKIVNGVPVTVVDGLPSSQTTPMTGSLVSGVADVAFVNGQLYGIETAAGCSHGLLHTDNTVFRVNSSGPPTPVANLSDFVKAHPVAQPEDEDFEPDGTWYSMIAVRGYLYAVESNHGEIDRIDPETGAIERVIDVSASQGHIVPTAIAYKGNFFFGNLNPFPIQPGSSSLYKVTPSGQIVKWVTGLTTVLGLVAGERDRLYVLESMTLPGGPTPDQEGSGRILQIDPNGSPTVIATGFSFPTALRMGPDGALYVSDRGFGGPTPGQGRIVRVPLS